MSKMKFAAKTFVVVGVLAGVGYGAYRWHLSSTIKKAQASLDKGFAALAVEQLEGHRNCLTTTKVHCELLLNTYYSAKNPQRLEWASQACLSSGVEIPEAYIGMASAKEFTGQFQAALQVLGGAIEKFKDIPDLFYRMAKILIRLENHNGAVQAFQQAMQKAPTNTNIMLEALDYFVQLKAWDAAKPIAEQLKTTDSDNLGLRLTVARVLKNTGDNEGAKKFFESSKPFIERSPARAQVEKAFTDVLEGKDSKEVKK